MAPTPKTDADLIDLWLAGRPASTRLAYTRDVKLFREAVGKRLGAVDGADVARFAAGLRGSESTQARRIASIKSLFGFALKVGLLDQNPTLVIRCPRTEGAVHERILTEEEVTLVTQEAAPGRDRCLVRTLYLAGLRISEALGLRFREVGRKWLTVHGKGNRTRTVVVPLELVEELRALRWKADSDDAFIFRGQSTRPISGRYARRMIRVASEEAIGRPISPHFLRHTHATVALEKGAPIHLVQNSLGHRSLATTAAYLHVRPNQGSSQYLSLGTRCS
jgi:site-specific recombinase XerD